MTSKSLRELRNDYLNSLSLLLKENKQNTKEFHALIKELERISIMPNEAIYLASQR